MKRRHFFNGTISKALVTFAQEKFELGEIENNEINNLITYCSAIMNNDVETGQRVNINFFNFFNKTEEVIPNPYINKNEWKKQPVVSLKQEVQEKKLYIPILLACLIEPNRLEDGVHRNYVDWRKNAINIISSELTAKELFEFYQTFSKEFKNFYGQRPENYGLNSGLVTALNERICFEFNSANPKKQFDGIASRESIWSTGLIIAALAGAVAMVAMEIGLLLVSSGGVGLLGIPLVIFGAAFFITAIIFVGRYVKNSFTQRNEKLAKAAWFEETEDDKKTLKRDLVKLIGDVNREIEALIEEQKSELENDDSEEESGNSTNDSINKGNDDETDDDTEKEEGKEYSYPLGQAHISKKKKKSDDDMDEEKSDNASSSSRGNENETSCSFSS